MVVVGDEIVVFGRSWPLSTMSGHLKFWKGKRLTNILKPISLCLDLTFTLDLILLYFTWVRIGRGCTKGGSS
jgi:hypothetical protein